MSDWTPHADAVFRAVPEDEAIRAVRDALEKRYRALVQRLRDAGDEQWADNIRSWNSYRQEPARLALTLLEDLVSEHITCVQLKEINDRMADDRERLIAERDAARQDRDEWKALHGSAVHEMQARIDRQERAYAGLRRAYEHACEQRDKYQRRTVEWRQAAADVAVECNMYRDLAKDLYDDEPCWFDHHGGCQAHGWLEPEPGEACPDGRAQRLFEGGDNDADGN